MLVLMGMRGMKPRRWRVISRGFGGVLVLRQTGLGGPIELVLVVAVLLPDGRLQRALR